MVSVSKTPGHTKHFQTIFLTPNVRLCDCPGLVFPSKVPRTLQILVGSFPIAHLREPYTAVGFLGKYLDLPNLLKISHPSGDKAQPGETLEWSAYDICEGWAVKRGFMTKKAARPDVARAANHLLRLSLEGRICLYLRPVNYCAEKARWESHPDLAAIQAIQALEGAATANQPWQEAEEESSDDEGEDEHDEDEDDDSDESNESADDQAVASHQNKFALLEDDD